MSKRLKITLSTIAAILILGVLYSYFSQILISHDYFIPNYQKEVLTEQSSAQTIFKQTGLSPAAARAVLDKEGFKGILKYQDAFFEKREYECSSLLGFFTKEDELKDDLSPPFASLKEGDIILTLSTHSLGWRHGHTGLVVGEDSILEAAVLGTNAEIYSSEPWRYYSQYVVLRLKDSTPEFTQSLASYAKDVIRGAPYRLTSGFIGPKAPKTTDFQFGVHCSYLAWYAYQHFGYDLDSDGGRLVSSLDILNSPHLEVVQLYGFDPNEFLSRICS